MQCFPLRILAPGHTVRGGCSRADSRLHPRGLNQNRGEKNKEPPKDVYVPTPGSEYVTLHSKRDFTDSVPH